MNWDVIINIVAMIGAAFASYFAMRTDLAVLIAKHEGLDKSHTETKQDVKELERTINKHFARCPLTSRRDSDNVHHASPLP